MNIQNKLTAAIALAIGLAAAVPALADNTDTTTTTTVVKTNHHYVYYGEHQIYFAPDTKTYYWQNNGGGEWQSGAVLPVDSQGFVKTGGVQIDLDTDHPYERNEWVRKHYMDKHDDSNQNDRDHH